MRHQLNCHFYALISHTDKHSRLVVYSIERLNPTGRVTGNDLLGCPVKWIIGIKRGVGTIGNHAKYQKSGRKVTLQRG